MKQFFKSVTLWMGVMIVFTINTLTPTVQAAVYTAAPSLEESSVHRIANASAFTNPDLRPQVPDIVFHDRSGVPVRLSKFRGNVVVLNVWAMWCSPCLNQLQSFNRIQEKVSRKPVAIIPLSVDPGGIVPIRDFFTRQRLDALRPFIDPEGVGKTPRLLQIGDIPTTLIIDKRGREVLRVVGAQNWDNPAVLDMLEALRQEK